MRPHNNNQFYYGDKNMLRSIFSNIKNTRLQLSKSDAKVRRLEDAILFGNIKKVQSLLEAGVDPHTEDENGETPCALAIKYDEPEILRLFVKRKADFDKEDRQGCTPLHRAVEKKDQVIVNILLDAKANINCRAKNGMTTLYVAVNQRDVALTQLLLERKADPNINLGDGFSPLSCAANHGDNDIVKLLLKANANIYQIYNEVTALYFAAQEGYAEVVDTLIKADPKILDTPTPSPLITAATKGHLSVVEVLLKAGMSPNVASESTGMTPLSYAAKNGHKELALALLKAGANANWQMEDMNVSPLVFAVREEHPEITQLLLDYKADPNQRFGLWETSLMEYASLVKKLAPIAEMLREAGASQIPGGQGFVIERMKKHGMKAFDLGVCFGVISTGMQKFFSGKFHEFHQQLEIMARIPKEDFETYISGVMRDRIKYVERAEIAICEEFMEESGVRLKPEDLWSAKLSDTQRSELRKKVNEKIKEYESDNKDDGLASEIPALFEAIDAYLFSRRYLHLFPKTYDLIVVADDKNYKETSPKIGQLLVTQGESNALKYKVITPLEDLKEDQIITSEELKAELKDKYNAFNEALKSNDISKLSIFLPNILAITSKRDHTLSKDIPIDNQNFLQTLSLFASKDLNPEDMVTLDVICGIYTKEELEFYFMSLYDAFEKFPGRIAFEIQNTNHAMGIFADSSQSHLWGFLDPNKMPLRGLTKQELAKKVLKGYQSEKILGLHLRMYVHKNDRVLALSHLQAWKDQPRWRSMHEVTESRAQMVDDSKATWLNLAVKHNHIDLAKALIAVKADPNHAEGGTRPLYLAAQNGKLEMIKLLHSHGASLEEREEGGGFPLYIAAQEGQWDTVKYLLDAKIDPNTENNYGYIPLFGAATSNHLEVLNLLLEAKSDIRKTGEGQSVLFQAAGKGHADIVKALINAKADVDVVTKENATALYIAAQKGYADVVKVLIEAKANIDIAYDNRTPLYKAVENGHLSSVKILLAADAYRSINICHKVGFINRTLLMCAAEKGHIEVVRELLDKGADYNIGNSMENNALYYALYEGHLDIADLLMKKGMKIDVKENAWSHIFFNIAHKNDLTKGDWVKSGALMLLLKAIEQQNIQLIELVMNRNIDPNLPIEVNLYALRERIKDQGSSAIQRLDNLLKTKSIKSGNLVQIAPIELAIVIGNPRAINCVSNQKYPISTFTCSLWNKRGSFSFATGNQNEVTITKTPT